MPVSPVSFAAHDSMIKENRVLLLGMGFTGCDITEGASTLLARQNSGCVRDVQVHEEAPTLSRGTHVRWSPAEDIALTSIVSGLFPHMPRGLSPLPSLSQEMLPRHPRLCFQTSNRVPLPFPPSPCSSDPLTSAATRDGACFSWAHIAKALATAGVSQNERTAQQCYNRWTYKQGVAAL